MLPPPPPPLQNPTFKKKDRRASMFPMTGFDMMHLNTYIVKIMKGGGGFNLFKPGGRIE